MAYTAYDVVTYAGLRLIDVVAILLSNIILAVGYAFVHFPNASTLVVALLAVYIIYKTLRRIVRFWLNMFITMVKLTVFSVVIFVLLAVYVRGFNRFFTKDIYFIKELLASKADASDEAFKQYAYKIMNDDRFEFLQGARDFFEGSTFHIDESYEGLFDNIRENLNRGFQDVLGQDGLQNLNNFLNNFNN